MTAGRQPILWRTEAFGAAHVPLSRQRRMGRGSGSLGGDRRNRIIARLEEQKALLANPNFKRKIKVREKNAAGVKELVEKQQKVLPWWRVAQNGSYAFGIRAGKQVEFEKGKTAVTVPSLDKLPGVIDTLISAVRKWRVGCTA
jgi:hypothetical protein